MDTKVLYILSVAIASVVGGFYYYSGDSEKLQVSKNQDLSSTADKIQITQTNESGQLYAKANIQHMTQWMQGGRAELENLKGILYQDGKPSSTFNADKAVASNEYQNIELLNNVTLSKLNDAQQALITFKTDQLLGDTKSNKIQTDRTVSIINAQAQFTSQGLTANLNTGQYEFFNIRGKYDPVSQ